jgi:hypothetical protein
MTHCFGVRPHLDVVVLTVLVHTVHKQLRHCKPAGTNHWGKKLGLLFIHKAIFFLKNLSSCSFLGEGHLD